MKNRELWKKLRSGDRMIIDENLNKNEIDCHMNRYRFACGYVNGKTVFDAGCGTGYGSKILKNTGARLVIGIDNSEESIEYAKKKFSSESIEFYSGDICDDSTYLRLPIKEFELITCFEVLEHVSQPHVLLTQLYRHLVKGGMLILSTPNKLIEEKMICHENEFSVRELKDYLDKNTQFSGYKLYGQRLLTKDRLDPVIQELRKEIAMHSRASDPDAIKCKIKNSPVAKVFYPVYQKTKSKFFPTKKGILDRLSSRVEPVGEEAIPYTQVITVTRA